MFCTFTTEHGTLVVRTQDIRRLQDRPEGTRLVWVEEDARQEAIVHNTAAENLARLIAEDQAKSAAYAQMQQRAANGLPVPPILRGKAGR